LRLVLDRLYKSNARGGADWERRIRNSSNEGNATFLNILHYPYEYVTDLSSLNFE